MTKPLVLLHSLGIAVGLLAVTTATSAPPSTANSETLLKAINFALLGTDGDKYVWKSRADCVVVWDENDPNFHFHSIEEFHLNNVDVSRIRIQPYALRYEDGHVENNVKVELHGEGIIRQYAAQLNPESAPPLTLVPTDSRSNWLGEYTAQLPITKVPQPSGAPLPERQSSTDWTYNRQTSEFDRMMRAWKYIYTHGCTGARSSF